MFVIGIELLIVHLIYILDCIRGHNSEKTIVLTKFIPALPICGDAIRSRVWIRFYANKDKFVP